MYNESLKSSFIADYTKSLSTAQHAQVVFDAFAPSEEMWGADLCTRTAEELQPVVNSVAGLRAKSRWMALTILKEYVKWCLAMKVPGAIDGMLKIEVVGLDKVRSQMVSGPMHLQQYLNAVFEPEAEETIDNIYRCFFWLAFAGIDEEEDIFLVTKDDVDFENMVIRYGFTEYPIYREAIPAIRNAMTLTSFAYKHPSYSKVIKRDRVIGVTLMRGIKADSKILTLRSTLSKRARLAYKEGRTPLQLSYYRVWISGLFYRMYENERAGGAVSFAEEAQRYVSKRVYHNEHRPLSTQQNIVARDYMDDYQRWKLAFAR